MSITDELRKYATVSWNPWSEARDRLLQMCDRIDAEHERQLEVLYRDMSDAEWVRLPVDADGVPIHLGDMMHGTCPSGKYVCGEVSAIGDNKFWLINVQFSLHPGYMRHYHAPTVEDVLRGVVTLCHNTWKEGSAFEFYDVDDVMKSGNIADFAAKLRLAGDAE